MNDSAGLKIERAKQHVAEANDLLRKTRPFSYVLEINNKTGERATFAKKNDAVVNELALICGDAIHNLCAALDHAWWWLLFPTGVPDVPDAKNVQFPFAQAADRLNDIVGTRSVGKATPEIRKKVNDLKPYPGGHEMLYLLHEFDVIDKHKLLVPLGDYTEIDTQMLRQQIPDLPGGFNGTFGFGSNARDIVWTGAPSPYLTGLEKREKELHVPVNVVLKAGSSNNLLPLIPTLHGLTNVAVETIEFLRR